ncbi:hypothetical protein BGZ80_009827 [Entomortierella chlamydospora]|uniref:HTH CENPB-type domain-containing protein n=1 Tax=Entomortierella chlamydospora TaxID=101097 RepID=A0A9P6MWG7_9FUNG|nr:hypothetical protein BGZ80_009827 [Entomortierella chlamydospora]
MGVFGEKHTSLTREQKRQLIRQADAHKLRPTEVCDWVLATWGLRIARVTVYSILHKQRASLMAGHKDLYSAMQGGHSGDACNGQSTKYRTSKRARSANSGARGDSVGCDLPSTSHVGEGARWEGQLKRVREPASVELDRAMVQFLKSSEAVDAHGRRLNDAELQSHALRLAREIPSASRMRCSFGWLRHFKRRLGVQWAADQLGRYRWIVEMDPFASNTEDSQDDTQSSANVGTTSGEKSLSSDAPISASRLSHTNSSSRCHGNIKREHDDKKTQQSIIDEKDDDADEDEEYHSSQELLGKDYDLITPTIVGSSVRNSRSTSTSTSTPGFPYTNASFPLGHLQQSRRSLDLQQHHHQQQQQHRHYSFSESSSLSSLGQFPSQPLSIPSTSLSHPPQSAFLNLHPASIPHTSQSHSQSSILDTFPNLFDSLPTMNTPPSSQLLPNNSLSNIHNDTTNADANKSSPSPFEMGVDGGVRKVPSKDEAYDMLQSLLLYYEQDHHYVGEQQTLLLPRWIHQQRQVMQEADINEAKMMWMRQRHSTHQQTQTSPFSSSSPTPSTPSYTPYSLPSQSLPNSSYSQAQTHRSESTCSSPPSSPPSTSSPITTSSTLGSAGANRMRGNIHSNGQSGSGSNGPAGLDHFNVNGAFPSLTSPIEQQMFFAHHHALQQQFAMQQHQQHQQATATPPYSLQSQHQ